MTRPTKYTTAEHTIDYTPLRGIKPVFRGRGYSLFTESEIERIKAFYRKGNVCQIWIARHLGCDANVINQLINGTTKFHRPNLTGKYKADYARQKTLRQNTSLQRRVEGEK